MIENISIEKLYQHPENPRIDLGDLTELADSIKENGVLQNLTVVPIEDSEDEYFVVIGNRRLEASKLAGLEELPCSVVDMDYKTQIGTMLLENMQRDDLTPYEEAKGIQMMMDLGDSIADISKKTGLSETTVRHRVKLNELDEEVLAEKCEQNITITDLIKLEAIKDPERKNKALEAIGTNNFDWTVSNAVAEEKREAVMEELRQYVSEKAEELSGDKEEKKTKKTMYNMWIYYATDIEQLKEEIDEIFADDTYFAEGEKVYFLITGNSIEFLRDKTEADDEVKNKAKEEQDEKEKVKTLMREKADAIFENTDAFIRNELTEAGAKKHGDLLIRTAAEILAKGSTVWSSRSFLYECAGLADDETSRSYEEKTEAIVGYVDSYPNLSLVQMVYCHLKPSGFPVTYDMKVNEYMRDRFEEMYAFLEVFGYTVSDEERSVADGTHELYSMYQPPEEPEDEFDDGEYDDEYYDEYDDEGYVDDEDDIDEEEAERIEALKVAYEDREADGKMADYDEKAGLYYYDDDEEEEEEYEDAEGMDSESA